MTEHDKHSLLGWRTNRLAAIWRRNGWWRSSSGRWQQQRLSVAQLCRLMVALRDELREE